MRSRRSCTSVNPEAARPLRGRPRARAAADRDGRSSSPGHSGSTEVVQRRRDWRPSRRASMCCYPVWEGADRAGAPTSGIGLRASSLLAPAGTARASCAACSARSRRSPPEALYIDALATAPAFRRRGVARALLARPRRTAPGDLGPDPCLPRDGGRQRACARLCTRAAASSRDEAEGRQLRGAAAASSSYVQSIWRSATTRPSP